tara:strand:+ start:100477 stop:100902 length:426 start_codon:yes stop_codon:yes gene_type:complete
MELELRYLTPYLRYRLKCFAEGENIDDYSDPIIPKEFEIVGLDINYVEIHEIGRTVTEEFIYSEIYPILRPISDLKKEEFKMYSLNKEAILYLDDVAKLPHNNREELMGGIMYRDIRFLFKNHFDVFGLIGEGLAVDINTI